MVKSCPTSLCPSWGMNHPFVQHILGWGGRGGEIPYLYNLYYTLFYNCSILLLVVNLLAYLIYELNFIIGMYVYKKT